MARVILVGFRRFVVLAFVLIIIYQVLLMLQIHHQNSNKNKRKLWCLFRNLSLQELTPTIQSQSATRHVMVKDPKRITRSWAASTSNVISNNSSYISTAKIKNTTAVLKTASRQENVTMKHNDNLTEVNTKKVLLNNETISGTMASTLPSWIPENIINLSISNISDIFECNLPASENSERAVHKNNLQICPCVPNNLKKHIFYDDYTTATYESIQSKYKDISVGGHWIPQTCVPRHSVAIIVPYRDREDHLVKFLDYMHRFLQKQLLNYTIIIAEQGSPSIFNKAKIMNAAYMESKKIKSFDCYVFHDVDMLPEDERNMYTCPSMPRHQGIAADTWNYNIVYTPMIGGVAVYRPEHFELINGYSNKFWGWGAEDDNMYRRIFAKKLKVLRPPHMLARYTMIKHGWDKGNPRNTKRVEMVNGLLKIQDSDGLNSLKYKTLVRREKPLYTWMLFDITE